jgi:hypothetical protein
MMLSVTKKLGMAGLASALVVLAGCQYMQTDDPYTGEREVNKTTKGAVIGAATGAVVGLITAIVRPNGRKRH